MTDSEQMTSADLVSALTSQFTQADLPADQKAALRKLVTPPRSESTKQKQAASQKARQQVRYKEDPQYREKVLERTNKVYNTRYHSDEEFRERCKARARENYQKRKQLESIDDAAYSLLENPELT